MGVGPQEQVEAHRLRELRRAPEAAPVGIEGAAQSGVSLAERVGTGDVVARFERGPLPDRLGQLARLCVEVVATGAPDLVDAGQQVGEAEHAAAGHLREVGAAEERPTVGHEEDRHRPPALAGHGLDGVHVDGVDVGSFLAVDLHADEALVHQRGGRVVLEGLVRHDVAPVAGRVTHREQHGAVLGPRPLERLVAPRVPVDRVVRVLAEVRARLVGQTVHSDKVSGGLDRPA